jgi:hypothetical protein
MEKNYTFWQRTFADTPTFFKKIQLFGIALTGLGTALLQVHGMPTNLTTILISIGSSAAIIAQFAVKEYEIYNTEPNATK